MTPNLPCFHAARKSSFLRLGQSGSITLFSTILLTNLRASKNSGFFTFRPKFFSVMFQVPATPKAAMMGSKRLPRYCSWSKYSTKAP
jgi:hypothetical protein